MLFLGRRVFILKMEKGTEAINVSLIVVIVRISILSHHIYCKRSGGGDDTLPCGISVRCVVYYSVLSEETNVFGWCSFL